MAAPKEILYETLGYNGDVSVTSINKSNMRRSLETIDDLLDKKKDDERRNIKRSIMENEIQLLEIERIESRNYPYGEQKKKILSLVKRLGKTSFVDNSINISEIRVLLNEYEGAQRKPEEFEKRIDSFKKILREQEIKDISQIESRVVYEIGQVFKHMGIIIDGGSESFRVGHNIKTDSIDSMELKINKFLSDYEANISALTRNAMYNILIGIKNMRSYVGEEKNHSEPTLMMYLALFNGISPLKEMQDKGTRKEFFFIQQSSNKMIEEKYSANLGFVELYDKVPINLEYIRIVKNAAKQIRALKIKKE